MFCSKAPLERIVSPLKRHTVLSGRTPLTFRSATHDTGDGRANVIVILSTKFMDTFTADCWSRRCCRTLIFEFQKFSCSSAHVEFTYLDTIFHSGHMISNTIDRLKLTHTMFYNYKCASSISKCQVTINIMLRYSNRIRLLLFYATAMIITIDYQKLD